MEHSLYALLSKLEERRLHFTLSRHRPDSVLVTITLVGQRVEVDVFSDAHMEVSVFSGDENVVGGAEVLSSILQAEGAWREVL